MALTYVDYTGDGTTSQYVFSFEGQDSGYFDPDHISVLVEGDEVPFEFLSSNTIRMGAPPPDGSSVRIQRTVPNDVPYADFSRGNNFGQEVLNRSFLQQLYLIQQIMDGRYPDGYAIETDVAYSGDVTFEAGVSIPASDPNDPDSAVSYGQADLRYVNRSGDTMEGFLSVPEATQNVHAARYGQLTGEAANIRDEFRAADAAETAARSAADASLQDQFTGIVPPMASQMSPISWHGQVIENSVNIPEGVNAFTVGPVISIQSGQVVTIGEGSSWTIVNGAAAGDIITSTVEDFDEGTL